MIDKQGSYIMEVEFVGGGKTGLFVDSGADESVCPKEWGEALFGTDESATKMRFRGAGGDVIKHHGQRNVLVVSPFKGRTQGTNGTRLVRKTTLHKGNGSGRWRGARGDGIGSRRGSRRTRGR